MGKRLLDRLRGDERPMLDAEFRAEEAESSTAGPDWGIASVQLESLQEAREDSAGLVVLEGHSGEVTYVAAPAHMVRCDQGTLERLAVELDRSGPLGEEKDETSVTYARRTISQVARGEDSRGTVEDGIWVNDAFAKVGLVEPIREVLEGERDRLPGTHRGLEVGAAVVGGIVGAQIADGEGFAGAVLEFIAVVVTLTMFAFLARWISRVVYQNRIG